MATRINDPDSPVSFTLADTGCNDQYGHVIIPCPSSLTGPVIGPGLMFVCITRWGKNGTQLHFSLNHDYYDARWRSNPFYDHDIDGQQRNELQRASITSLDLNIIATSTDHMIQGDSQAMRAVILVVPLSENSTRSFSVKCEVQYLDTIYPYEKILTSGNL